MYSFFFILIKNIDLLRSPGSWLALSEYKCLTAFCNWLNCLLVNRLCNLESILEVLTVTHDTKLEEYYIWELTGKKGVKHKSRWFYMRVAECSLGTLEGMGWDQALGFCSCPTATLLF